jgi:hypothetical protein
VAAAVIDRPDASGVTQFACRLRVDSVETARSGPHWYLDFASALALKAGMTGRAVVTIARTEDHEATSAMR